MGEKTDLLEKMVDAHGGMKRRQGVRQIALRLQAAGLALRTRFQAGAFRDLYATVSAATPKVIFNPFPRKGQQGVFESGTVGIIDGHGRLVKERKNPREAFKGFRRSIYWDTLDTLYFGGYALWNYLNLPFLLLLPGTTTVEIEPWREKGNVLRRLHVTFPPDTPTHSPEQVFYIDRSGLVIRHDYTALVFGRWAKAAHYSWDHREFDGLVFPLRRRVFPRLPSGRPLPWLTLVSLTLNDIKIRKDDP